MIFCLNKLEVGNSETESLIIVINRLLMHNLQKTARFHKKQKQDILIHNRDYFNHYVTSLINHIKSFSGFCNSPQKSHTIIGTYEPLLLPNCYK